MWWLYGYPAGQSVTLFWLGQADDRTGARKLAGDQQSDILAGPYRTLRLAESDNPGVGTSPPDGSAGGGGTSGSGGNSGNAPVSTNGSGAAPALSHLSQRVAEYAIDSIGHAYEWGGAPGPEFTAPWDCSSAVNSWWGGMAGQAIPGYGPGEYDGTEHGPSTLGWLGWIDTGVYELARSQVGPGDIICWQTHMGVAVDGSDMVSALDPSQGTQRTLIDGLIPGEQMYCLRLISIDPSETGHGFTPIPGAGEVRSLIRGLAQDSKQLIAVRNYADSLFGHRTR